MVLYECYNCGYTNLHKCKMRNHLDRKKICKPIRKNINLNEFKETILQGLSYQEYLNLDANIAHPKHNIDTTKIQHLCIQNTISSPKSYKCKYCAKEYKFSQSLYRHHKSCKEKIQLYKPDTQLGTDMINMYKTQLKIKDIQFNKLLIDTNKQIRIRDKHCNKLLTNVTTQINVKDTQIEILKHMNKKANDCINSGFNKQYGN